MSDNTKKRIEWEIVATDKSSGTIAKVSESYKKAVKEMERPSAIPLAGAPSERLSMAFIRPERSPQEQEIRDRMAGTIRGMREKANRASIQDEVRNRLFGSEAESEQPSMKAGAKMAESFEGGFLNTLKSNFGRGSAFTQVARILSGSGPVLGAALAATAAEKVAAGILKISQELRDPEKSAAAIAVHFGESLPILGQIVHAGQDIREIIAREGETIDGVNRGVENTNKVLEFQRDLAREIAKERREAMERELELQGRIRLAMLQGRPREDEERRQSASKAERSAYNERFDAGQAKIDELDHKLTVLRAAALIEKKASRFGEGRSLKADPDGSGHIVDEFAKGTPEADARAQYESLQRTIKSVEGRREIASKEKTQKAQIAASDETDARRREDAAVRNQRAAEDVARFRNEDFSREINIYEQKRTARDATLKEQGRFYTAEIEQIRSSGAMKKTELDRQAIEEIERRKRELGETQKQAEGIVRPGAERQKAAIDAATKAQEAEARTKNADEILQAEREHGDHINDVRAKVGIERLRQMGLEAAAEKSELAKQHEDKLRQIKEHLDDELKQHAERAPELRKQAKEDAAAENSAFGSDLESLRLGQLKKNREKFRAADSVSSSSSHLITGVTGQGLSVKDRNADEQKSLLTEVKKLSTDQLSVLRDLLAEVKKNGGALGSISILTSQAGT